MSIKARGCPKCGGRWTRTSGFIVCKQCGHVVGSQNQLPRISGLAANPLFPIDEYERETNITDPPGNRNPLNFSKE